LSDAVRDFVHLGVDIRIGRPFRGVLLTKEVITMKKGIKGMIWIAAVCILFAALPGPACAAGLTIADGAVVIVNGGASISLGCQSVVIESGGYMALDHVLGPGALYKCGKVQVDPGGSLDKGNGKIIHNCAVPPEIMLLLLRCRIRERDPNIPGLGQTIPSQSTERHQNDRKALYVHFHH